MANDWYKWSKEDYELKPCPFCGATTECDPGLTFGVMLYVCKDTKEYNIECRSCSAMITGESEDSAVEKWNQRI